MEFEYEWLLILPVFFGLGWVAARIDLRQVVNNARAIPQRYFRALNELLDNQLDKGVDTLIEISEAQGPSVELQLVLAKLFRRKGELNRAIRLHQAVLERPDLDEPLRIEALTELGRDFVKTGLLDRAEEVWMLLLQTAQAAQAQTALFSLYQQSREWAKAIDVAQQMRTSSYPLQPAVAHFYCELAEQASSEVDWVAAKRFLSLALQAHRQCARATVLQGDVAVLQGDLEAAIRTWKSIAQQNPAFLALIAEKALRAYQRLERIGEGLTLLTSLYQRYPSLDLLLPLIDELLRQGQIGQASTLLIDELKRSPSLTCAARLLSLQLQRVPFEKGVDMSPIQHILAINAESINKYVCSSCGFRTSHYFWQCISCAAWESYAPERREG